MPHGRCMCAWVVMHLHVYTCIAPHCVLLDALWQVVGRSWCQLQEAARPGCSLRKGASQQRPLHTRLPRPGRRGAAGPLSGAAARAREEGASWRPAGATVFWLQEALRSLDGDLRARFGAGAGIAFRRGPSLAALQGAAAELGAGAVFMGRRWAAPVAVLCMPACADCHAVGRHVARSGVCWFCWCRVCSRHARRRRRACDAISRHRVSPCLAHAHMCCYPSGPKDPGDGV